MSGLPKKYAKMGFKKGWREYKKTHGKTKTKSKTKTSKKGGNPVAKKSYRRRAQSGLANPYVKGAGISVGGNILGRAVGVNPNLAKIGLSMIGPVKSKQVTGFLIGEMIQTGGGIAGLTTGAGAIGAIQGAL